MTATGSSHTATGRHTRASGLRKTTSAASPPHTTSASAIIARTHAPRVSAPRHPQCAHASRHRRLHRLHGRLARHRRCRPLRPPARRRFIRRRSCLPRCRRPCRRRLLRPQGCRGHPSLLPSRPRRVLPLHPHSLLRPLPRRTPHFHPLPSRRHMHHPQARRSPRRRLTRRRRSHCPPPRHSRPPTIAPSRPSLATSASASFRRPSPALSLVAAARLAPPSGPGGSSPSLTQATRARLRGRMACRWRRPFKRPWRPVRGRRDRLAP